MVETKHRLNSPVRGGLEQQRHFLLKLGGLEGQGSSGAGVEVLVYQRQFLSKLVWVEMPK